MKKIFIVLFMLVLMMSSVLAIESVAISGSSSQSSIGQATKGNSITVKEINQDPVPSQPGAYVDIYIKIINGGTTAIPTFELKAQYPFTIDQSTANANFPALNSGEKATLHYRLNVDKSAIPGDYELEFRTYSGDNSYFQYYFNIKVDDVTTDFDTVVQEFSGSQVSIGLLNIGKNTANALVVKIPKQENFTVSGPSGQIIGNLAAGDYTLVSFTINPKVNRASTTNNQGRTGNQQIVQPIEQNQDKILQVEIDYTDLVGERRVIIKDLEFTASLYQGTNSTRLAGGFNKTTPTTSTSSTTYIIGGLIVVIILFIITKKYLNNKKRKQEQTPQWIKSEKVHKK